MRLIFLTIFIFLVIALNCQAVTLSGCSREELQSAIDSADDNTTIYVPADTCPWDSNVTITNKNINIIGAGIGQTVITGNGRRFAINATSKASFRVSGFTFDGEGEEGSASTIAIFNDNSTSTKGWRLDHIRFNYAVNNGASPITVTGITWGVIDNCIFDGTGYVSVHVNAWSQSDPATQYGKASWDLPLNLGTDEAVYIEDCQFNFTGGNVSFVNDLWYGGRMVVRYNTLTHAAFQTHAARANARGGLKYEIYNNTFTGAGFIRPSHIRSGTGVIFNNQVSGYGTNNFIIDNQRTCLALATRCDGNDTTWDGNTSGEYGWPCLDQIGRGSGYPVKEQPSVPLYAWNNGDSVIALNGDSDLCVSNPPPTYFTHLKTTGDSPAHTGGVLDYVNNGTTPKPGYTPYTYPHPLRNESSGGSSSGSSNQAGPGSSIIWGSN